jgi:hypothetical protein
MGTGETYKCRECGREIAAVSGEIAPECCGAPMEKLPLPYCTHAYDPEATRPGIAEGPCDDGVK